LRFDLTLALTDKPGQLLKTLKPIANNGGNIISIIHERDKHADGYVPVSLVVDFPSNLNLKKAINRLKDIGIAIIKSKEIIETVKLTFMMIGSLDLKKIIKESNGEVIIKGYEVSTPPSEEACLKLELEVPTDSINKVLDNLKKVSKIEKTVLISSI
jgi:ACT domain-containing protein